MSATCSILIFAPSVSPSQALRLAEATYPGDHGKVGAGQPIDWAALPGKGNDSPWLGPTFIEEETTHLKREEKRPTFEYGKTHLVYRKKRPTLRYEMK